ncbi:MAG: hypothetical protein WAT92_18230, partial [Saprospiraceae bacterium]
VLGDPMTINGGLTYNVANTGKIVLGNHDLTLGASVGAISGAGANSYINTTVPGTGQLIKTMSSAAAYTFPVGDGSFYTPVTATPSGTSGSVSVAVENAAPSNLGTNPNYLTRNWRVNTTGFTSNALVGTYNQTNDVVGTEALIKGATLTGMTWSFTGSTGTPASDLVGATAPAGDVVFSGLTTLGSVKLKAFLAGAYSGGTMTTALRTAGLIPLSSPYPQAAASVGSIPNNNVTDWVLLEITNPSNSGDPAIFKSAFILNNGLIVDTDGTSDPQILGAYNPAFVRVIHRNHLSVRTSLGINTQTPTTQDFTTNSNVYINPSITTNSPQRVVSGNYMLWGGDVNGDEKVTYLDGLDENTFEQIPSDALGVLTNIGNVFSNSISNTYSKFDTNMDGTVTYLDGLDENTFEQIPSDALAILTFVGNVFGNLIQKH